jgi:hypothetical protein
LDMLEPLVPGISAMLALQRVQYPPRGFLSPPTLDPATESGSAFVQYATHSGPAPGGTFTDRLPPTAVAIAQAMPTTRAYARCEDFPLTAGVWQQVRGRGDWCEEVWPVGHLAMLSHPGRVLGWVRRTVGTPSSAAAIGQ